jgi:hypothetical protein
MKITIEVNQDELYALEYCEEQLGYFLERHDGDDDAYAEFDGMLEVASSVFNQIKEKNERLPSIEYFVALNAPIETLYNGGKLEFESIEELKTFSREKSVRFCDLETFFNALNNGVLGASESFHVLTIVKS